jgi:hypothetical protein
VTINRLTNQARKILERVRAHYEKGAGLPAAAESYREILATYYDVLIPRSASVLEVGCIPTIETWLVAVEDGVLVASN